MTRWFRFVRYNPYKSPKTQAYKKAFYRLVKYCSFDMTKSIGVKMFEHVGTIM